MLLKKLVKILFGLKDLMCRLCFSFDFFLSSRLRGITKSITRYPTFRRRFDSSTKNILEQLAKKNGGSVKSSSNGTQTIVRSKSMFDRIFSQKSFKGRTNDNGSDQEAQMTSETDIEIR